MLDILKLGRELSRVVNNLLRIEERTKGKLGRLLDELGKVSDARKISEILRRDSSIESRVREIAYPLESEFRYFLGELDRERARDILSGKVILGVDTSEMKPSAHYSPSFLLVNVGIAAVDYSSDPSIESRPISISEPMMFTIDDISSIYPRDFLKNEFSYQGVERKWFFDAVKLRCEREMIMRFVEDQGIEDREIVAMFDESFTLGHLGTLDAIERRVALWEFSKMLEDMREAGIIPIGVYHSRSRALTFSLIRGILCRDIESCRSCPEQGRICEEILARDSILMRQILDLWGRSCLFRVRNRILKLLDVGIVSFYIRVGEKNILRVDMPEWAEDRIETIHEVVAAQSLIGKEYPYLLSRAHELAVLKTGERRMILRMLDSKLRERGGEGLMISGKEERKVRGIV